MSSSLPVALAIIFIIWFLTRFPAITRKFSEKRFYLLLTLSIFILIIPFTLAAVGLGIYILQWTSDLKTQVPFGILFIWISAMLVFSLKFLLHLWEAKKACRSNHDEI